MTEHNVTVAALEMFQGLVDNADDETGQQLMTNLVRACGVYCQLPDTNGDRGAIKRLKTEISARLTELKNDK